MLLMHTQIQGCSANANSHMCGNVYDNNFGTDWYSPGGVGIWLTLNFPYAFNAYQIKATNRVGNNEGLDKSRRIRLDFTTTGGLVTRHVELLADNNFNTYTFDLVWEANSCKITVETVYTTANNGFNQVA
eukprot:CAMPEP_0182872702 /NCGR_PEP_ID=MMETSP0034_2-20130328/11879_1 /TAXON_ID=156128 /ORGANISM="Nephroselmis pyriformis, Strain CCMP717" /LENGTH=129 /DNA_ID=CAMNT_0025005309 /DNA_START=267 /DNA_END=653 /DNA_ORIENTATION=-